MPQLTLLDRISGTSYRVDSTDAVVGRDPSVALVIQGDGAPVVSGRHARVFLADGHWWIEDLGSRNGTFIAGVRLLPSSRHRLVVGEEFAFGTTGPRLRVEQAVGTALASTISEAMPAVPMRTMLEPEAAVPPPPAAPRPATASTNHVRVVIRTNDGKRLVAQGADVVIGRSRECGILIEGDMSRAVSRRHARVFYSGWKICIEDLGSKNGTWLNRKNVQAATILERGDVIEFGAGGPRLTVEDVATVSVDPPRKTETEMAVPETQPDPNVFISELPTPPARPAARASGEQK